MAAPPNAVLFRKLGDAVSFRVAGRATAAQSAPLRQCVERLAPARVRVDLRDCAHADSTFVGTLLHLDKTLRARGGGLALVMPSAACEKILRGMGLGDLLAREPDADEGGDWHELPAAPADPAAFRRAVTQAHEELAALPGEAGKRFEAVLRCIEQAARNDQPAE